MKIFLFALLILPMSILADGGLPNQPYIYVEGKAEIQKPADMVTLRFSVVGHGPDEPKANEEAQAKAVKILALLKSHKIADNDVIAENLSSEPEFEGEQVYPRNRGKIIGYTVNRAFEAKIKDVAIFPKLIDELIRGANAEFSAIESGLSKEKEMEDELWEKALRNARERTEKTLKTMNMKIDSVFAVSTVAFPEIRTKIFGTEERVIVTGSNILTAEPEYRLAAVTVSQSVHASI